MTAMLEYLDVITQLHSRLLSLGHGTTDNKGCVKLFTMFGGIFSMELDHLGV